MEKREKEVQFFWMEESNEQLPVPTRLKRKAGPKKMEYVGWGSKPLIDFLVSIGKPTEKQLSQFEVTAIVNEYINRNNLFHPGKKKRVLCDERLHSIFGRKSVGRNKIYDMLETHFSENNDDSEDEDELLYSSDEKEGNFMTSCKRQKVSSSEKKTTRKKRQEPETPKSCFAAIIPENIKLLYLKRSLVQDLLKEPESFEGKVVGSYVRIKSDPNDYFQKNSHQLLQVTGVRKASGCDDSGTGVLLQVQNSLKEVSICMLSDDNFSEEECEDLRQRVKDASLAMPTVVELEEKARILHEDITKHWLVRELALLQNLIDRANEKGWRRELFDYMERKQLLQTPAEQSKLLLEVPKVIAEALEPEPTVPDPAENVEEENSSPKSILRGATDISTDLEANPTLSTQNSHSTDAAGSKDAIYQSQFSFNSYINREGKIDFINGFTSVKGPEGIQATLGTCKEDKRIGSKDAVFQSQINFNSYTNRGNQIDFASGFTTMKEPEGIQLALGMYKQERKIEAQAAAVFSQQEKQPIVVMGSANSAHIQLMIPGENKGSSRHVPEKPVMITSQVIELSDDDEEAGDQCVRVQEPILDHPESSIWHYLDPQGVIQGPFSLTALKRWSDAFYFYPGFKVWKQDQSQDNAVLLTELISRMFPN